MNHNNVFNVIESDISLQGNALQRDIAISLKNNTLVFKKYNITITISDSYSIFLQKFNGLVLGMGSIFGIDTGYDFLNIEHYTSFNDKLYLAGYIPIASDGCGNLYISMISQAEFRDSPILFATVNKFEFTIHYVVASSFQKMIEFIAIDIISGQSMWQTSKEHMLYVDPDILKNHLYSLPWE